MAEPQNSRFERGELGSESDPAWRLVLVWPGLTAEQQLSWRYLWLESRGARRLITVTSDEVGRYRGHGNDAGCVDLKNLAAAGLVIVKDRDRARGQWILQVLDPVELHDEQLRRIDPDAQLDFGFDQQHCSDAEGSARGTSQGGPTYAVAEQALGLAAHGSSGPSCHRAAPSAGGPAGGDGSGAKPPGENPAVDSRRRECAGAFSPRHLHRESNLSHLNLHSSGSREDLLKREDSGSREDSVKVGRRESAGAFSPLAAGELVGTVLARLPTEVHLHRRALELAAEIKRLVACDRLEDSPVIFLAWAIVEGRVPVRELSYVIQRINRIESEGKLSVSRSAYFVGAVRRIAKRYRIVEA